MLKRRLAVILIAPIWYAFAAGGTTAVIAEDTAPGPVAQGRVALGAVEHRREREENQRVVCPGMAWKVGLSVELPCGQGAKILRAAFVEVNGGYCATVTYIAEIGSPARTKRVCEGGEFSREIARETLDSRVGLNANPSLEGARPFGLDR